MVKNDKAEVYNYLKDKEMDRLKRKGLTGIMYLLLFVFSGIMFLSLFVFSVTAGLSVNDAFVKTDCDITSVPYTVSVIDRYDEVYHSKNDTTQAVPVYKEVTKYRDVTDCSPQYIEIDEVRTESEVQGYKCSKKDDVITCDSMIDGNGDGKCDSGETCCTIKDGKNSCLNGIRKELPTKALEVTK